MPDDDKTLDFANVIKTLDFAKTLDFGKTLDFLSERGVAVFRELEALENGLRQSNQLDLATRAARAKQHLETMTSEFFRLAIYGKHVIAAEQTNGANGACHVHVHVHLNE